MACCIDKVADAVACGIEVVILQGGADYCDVSGSGRLVKTTRQESVVLEVRRPCKRPVVTFPRLSLIMDS